MQHIQSCETLGHVQVGVESLNLTEALRKAIGITVAKFGKKAVRVAKLCLTIFFSLTDLPP